MKVRLNYSKWQIILQILVFLLLMAGIFAALRLALTRQEIRKKAESPAPTLTREQEICFKTAVPPYFNVILRRSGGEPNLVYNLERQIAYLDGSVIQSWTAINDQRSEFEVDATGTIYKNLYRNFDLNGSPILYTYRLRHPSKYSEGSNEVAITNPCQSPPPITSPTPIGSSINLALYPSSETFNIGDIKSFDLKATFGGGSAEEKIDFFKTEILFPPSLKVPDSPEYAINTASSGLDKIIQVFDAASANASGKIHIELGSYPAGSGPTTDKPRTLAKIYFQAQSLTSAPQNLSFGKTQVVNNSSSEIPVGSAQGASFNVTETSTSPTPITSPTPVQTLTLTREQEICFKTAVPPYFNVILRRSGGEPNLVYNLERQIAYLDGSVIQSWTAINDQRSEFEVDATGTIYKNLYRNFDLNGSPILYTYRLRHPSKYSEGSNEVAITNPCQNIPTPTCSPPVCPQPPLNCHYEGQDSCSCGVLVCPAPSNTPIPSQQPSITPTSTPRCDKKSQGDANCDGVIDGVDYSIWLNSQCPPTRPTNAVCSDYRADFNNDTNVDDSDLAIWLQNRI